MLSPRFITSNCSRPNISFGGTSESIELIAGLLPVSFDPDIAIAALLPLPRNPHSRLTWPLLIMTAKPNPLAAGPTPMTGLPIDRRARRGRDCFGQRRRRRVRGDIDSVFIRRLRRNHGVARRRWRWRRLVGAAACGQQR